MTHTTTQLSGWIMKKMNEMYRLAGKPEIRRKLGSIFNF
jgi:hypothetical protein